jgi:hypothetical protein
MRSRYRKVLVAAGTALASMAMLASAAQAVTPPAPYEDFAGCPNLAENEFVASCQKLTFTGGHITLGEREVPIANPFTLVGATEQGTGAWVQNSEGGLSPVAQPVPGGLIGLTGFEWLDELSEKSLKLYATIELAGNPGLLKGPFALPVKVHLENPLLGKGCYVGSNEAPIQLSLKTGTTNPPAPNEPITGKAPGPFVEEPGQPGVSTASGGVYVDNAYAVPGATGCKLEVGPFMVPIDKVVNSAYGLPAAAGTNEAILDFNRSVATQRTVYGE